MSIVQVKTNRTLQSEAEKKISAGFIPNPAEMSQVVTPFLAGLKDQDSMFRASENVKALGSSHVKMSDRIRVYGGAFHVPKKCHTLGKDMSVSEMIQAGIFTSPQASANTLPADWQSLFDALRIDVSIRKSAREIIRDSFYNVVNMPNSSRIVDVTEFFPYAFEFQLNNGEGQAVNQGETRFGQNETIQHYLYATGFTRTLLSMLYDESYDPSKVSDAVTLAYNAKRDDLSISPILNFNYAGVSGSQTAADTTGANRQEKLYNTLENALDQFARRVDPITDRKLVATDMALLCEPEDARHIERVVNGFNTAGSSSPKNLPPIPSISEIIAYDGEVIRGRVKDVTYTGVTRGTAYLVKKNRYMNIGIKRGLMFEADMNPDVSTLAQEKNSWWFVEGQQTTGLQYFVQEVTLPAYTP